MRCLVWVLSWLLLLVSPVQGADTLFLFDYPLAVRTGVSFPLRITSTIEGRLTQTERFAAPLLSAQQCAEVLAAKGQSAPVTEETLGLRLCLEPGEYSVTVSATREGLRSLDSNVVDLRLSSSTPCTPLIVTKPKDDPLNALLGAGIITGVTAAAIIASQASGPGSLPSLVNMQCVHPKVVPAGCVCGFPPHPCASVTYWEPGWIVETVKKPGTSAVPLLGGLLETALSAVGVPPLGAGGAANAGGTGQTNLHFAEAHVYEFPQLLGGPCTSCGPSGGLALNYASELDPGWRVHPPASGVVSTIVNVGVWGRLFPRAGWVIHGSPPVASGLEVMRALSIAALPVSGTPPDVHPVLKPTQGLSTCLQPAYPRQKPCFTAGTPPMLWEAGTLSLKGTYIWIVWRLRTCCVEVAQAYCGLTLPGIGRTGMNACVVPSFSPP